MGNIKQQSLYYAVISYVGVILGALSTLIIQPRLLSPEIIGLLGTISDAAFLLVPLVKFGADAILVRYYFVFADVPNAISTLFYWVVKRLLWSIAIFIPVYLLASPYIEILFREKSILFVKYIYWVIPLTIALVFYSVIEAYTQIKKYTTALVFVREIALRLGIVSLILLFYYQLIALNFLVAYYVILHIVLLVLLLVFLKSKNILSINIAAIDTNKMPDILKYSILITVGGICGIAVTKIDSLLITKYLGLAQNGIYRISFFISVMIEIPGHALKQLVAPLVAQYAQEKNKEALETLYKRVSNNQLLIGVGLFLIIWFNIDMLFQIMPNGNIYAIGKDVFFWVGLAKLFDLATGNNEEIIAYSSYYTWALSVGIILIIVTIVTNSILIPQYGIVGAAFATSLTIVAYNLTKLIIIYIKFGILPISLKTLYCVGIGLFTWFVSNQLSIIVSGNPFIDIIVQSLFILIVYGVLVYYFKISQDVNNIVEKYVGLT
ncbi:MAG TPA: polysaccharide biosynthesis C-terminal domain-containing protein [Chitinophagales bacterium]|nr:polysaccharide biosynthesis C-terminal domain-containing protein [Chitinophagales bacterium]